MTSTSDWLGVIKKIANATAPCRSCGEPVYINLVGTDLCSGCRFKFYSLLLKDSKLKQSYDIDKDTTR